MTSTTTCSLSPPTSGSNNVDSTICSNVQFQLRDGVPGVSYCTRTLRIQLVGLLLSAGAERDLNCHPMFYAGFLLITPCDGTSQTVTLKQMKKSAFLRMQMWMCALIPWMESWPASHD